MRVASFFILLFSIKSSQFSDAYSSGSNKGDIKKCDELCKDYFDTKLDRRICQPALNIMPRPGVYNACIDGMIQGFRKSCVPACLKHGETKDVERPDSFTACQRKAKKAHPNHEFTWCRQSYEKTFEGIFSAMKDVMLTNDNFSNMNGERQEDSNLVGDVGSEYVVSTSHSYKNTNSETVIRDSNIGDESNNEGKTSNKEIDIEIEKNFGMSSDDDEKDTSFQTFPDSVSNEQSDPSQSS